MASPWPRPSTAKCTQVRLLVAPYALVTAEEGRPLAPELLRSKGNGTTWTTSGTPLLLLVLQSTPNGVGATGEGRSPPPPPPPPLGLACQGAPCLGLVNGSWGLGVRSFSL